jgi:CheY-like chemotaxis protein
VSTAARERDGDTSRLTGQVAERFGVLPNFFRPVPGTGPLLAGLWAFTQAAYLDCPLPSLFKERLFVHLSRFCEVRYCIIRHACFLAGLSRPAGDPDAPPQTVEQIIGLLRRPVPAPAILEAALRRLEAIPGTDLTRQLRGDGDGDGTRILAITAHADADTRDLALSAGADQFMTKPFAMNQLLEQAQALTSDRAS